MFATLFGVVFRALLAPNTGKSRAIQRHLAATAVGLALGYFLYGLELAHLILQYLGSYLALRFLPRRHVHWFLFVFSMGYMNSLQLYAQIFDYGNYTLDVSW